MRIGTLQTPFGTYQIQYEMRDGMAIYQGDVLLDPLSDSSDPTALHVESAGLGSYGVGSLWPDATVIYEWAPTISSEVRTAVLQAMQIWTDKAHVQFKYRTNETQFVTISDNPGYCVSQLGRLPHGQGINLDPSCAAAGDALHELGHTLGFWHEMARADRDQFVTIHWENIDPEFKSQFDKFDGSGIDLGTFDFDSVMMYSSTDFSVNGKPTITRLDGSTFTGATTLSPGDISGMVEMYKQQGGYGKAWFPFSRWGGVLTSSPAVSYREPSGIQPGTVDVFGRGQNGNVWYSSFTAFQHTARWRDLGGAITSDPAAVSWGPDRIDVFARSSRNSLEHIAFAGGNWSGWEDLGGVITSGPAAATLGPGVLYAFARGQDGAMWVRQYVADWGGWIGWRRLGGPITSDPVAVANGSGSVVVFARGSDNRCWQGSISLSSPWSGWSAVPGGFVMTSGPAVASWRDGWDLDLFARGDNGQLWHVPFRGSWGTWEDLGGVLTSDPDAVWLPRSFTNPPGNPQVLVVARGTDLSVWLKQMMR